MDGPRGDPPHGGPRNPEELARGFAADARNTDAQKLDLWPVEERPSGRLVGHCGLLPKQVEGKEETELVYVIAAADWGSGYATEIAS